MTESTFSNPADSPVTPVPMRPVTHFSCGFSMGICNVIPGGDSGTIALIIGIYQRIVTAISRVDATLLMLLLQRKWIAACQRVDLGFMLPLMFGVAVGIASMGTLMHYLVEHHFNIMMPIFFGLIAASCWMVAKLVERWEVPEMVALVLGVIIALSIVLQPGLAHPPEGLWYIVLCGFIGICALILPGISGAFLLLFLGKYHDLTGVIDRAIRLNFTGDDFAILVAFGIGCFLGLVSCSKFLRWLMEHYGSATMAALCGFKIGSLYKIWPLQVDTTPQITEFKRKVFEPVPLNQTQFDETFWLAITLVLISAGATLLLDRLALSKADEVINDEPTV